MNQHASYTYLGNAAVTWAALSKAGLNGEGGHFGAILADKPTEHDHGTICVGFIDGHVEELQPEAAKAITEESLKKMDGMRAQQPGK